jgi:hypothetical protein
MNRLIFFAAIIVSCTGCMDKQVDDRSIAIEVAFAQTWKVNLKKDTFTMFYMSRPPLVISLGLTEVERNRIIDAWYQFHLDRIEGKTTLKDNCNSMPKLFTIIKATTTSTSQEISIDEHCGDPGFFDSGREKRMKKFLRLVKDIVFSRPAVRDAPKSDVFYM